MFSIEQAPLPLPPLGLEFRVKDSSPQGSFLVENIGIFTKREDFADLGKDGTDRGRYGLTYDTNACY